MGCGGCNVYNEYYPGWNPGGFGSFNFPNPVVSASTDTLCQDTIKKAPMIEDSLKRIDSALIPSKKSFKDRLKMRFQKWRLFSGKAR
jgi:hypothetical protein